MGTEKRIFSEDAKFHELRQDAQELAEVERLESYRAREFERAKARSAETLRFGNRAFVDLEECASQSELLGEENGELQAEIQAHRWECQSLAQEAACSEQWIVEIEQQNARESSELVQMQAGIQELSEVAARHQLLKSESRELQEQVIGFRE